MNKLHVQALSLEDEDFGEFKAVSVTKKMLKENKQITPVHLACINPNPKYLKKLLAISPADNVEDDTLRRPIHYAAVCQGTGPLELLLKRNVMVLCTDNDGYTPLMLAAKHGRSDNVRLLLKWEQSNNRMYCQISVHD